MSAFEIVYYYYNGSITFLFIRMLILCSLRWTFLRIFFFVFFFDFKGFVSILRNNNESSFSYFDLCILWTCKLIKFHKGIFTHEHRQWFLYSYEFYWAVLLNYYFKKFFLTSIRSFLCWGFRYLDIWIFSTWVPIFFVLLTSRFTWISQLLPDFSIIIAVCANLMLSYSFFSSAMNVKVRSQSPFQFEVPTTFIAFFSILYTGNYSI